MVLGGLEDPQILVAHSGAGALIPALEAACSRGIRRA
jgi:hypothetical protein